MPLDRETFLEVVRDTPLVSIDLVVTNDKGEVLLGLRSNEPAKGYWFVPGGRIRKNETLDGAFSRIVECELGIRRSREGARLLGAYEHMLPGNFAGVPDVTTHYVVLAHHIKLRNDTIISPDAQHTELRWWPIGQAAQSDTVHKFTREYFPAVLGGR